MGSGPPVMVPARAIPPVVSLPQSREQLQVILDPPRKGLQLTGKDLHSNKPIGDLECMLGGNCL